MMKDSFMKELHVNSSDGVFSSLKKVMSFEDEIHKLDLKIKEELLQTYRESRKVQNYLLKRRKKIIKSFPNFWFRTIINHFCIAVIVQDYEKNCLYFLDDLEVEEFNTISVGFKIMFLFRSNPFFENTVLMKEFHLEGKDPSSTYTEIKWKEGQNILDHIVKDDKGNQDVETNKKTTFFTWYFSQSNPTSDEIAQAIRCDIWPNPLKYYLQSTKEEICISDEDFSFQSSSDAGEDYVNILKEEEISMKAEPDICVKEEESTEEEEEEENVIRLLEEEGIIERGPALPYRRTSDRLGRHPCGDHLQSSVLNQL